MALLRQIIIPRTKGTISYWTKQRIKKIHVHRKWNHVVNEPYFECTVPLTLSRGQRPSCAQVGLPGFIKDIDFDTDRLMVMHKDNDGLNNHYTNWVAGTKHEVLKKAL